MINDNFVFTTLDKNPEYYEDVIKLIEDEFKYEHNHKYELDFAPLLSPNNFENCFLIINKNSNELCAHLGFVRKILTKNKTDLATIFIGGIATKKKYQGQKLFSFLLNRCFTINQDAGLFILWSELENLYEKFGFTRCGAILETGKNVITKDNLPSGYFKTKFFNLTNKEFEEIKDIYKKEVENKFFTVKRNTLNWDVIQQMTTVDLFIKKNDQNKIISYFCYGKGNDLKQIIHELGSENFKQEIQILEPFKLWLTENYVDDYPNHQLQYNAFFKLGNIETFNRFISQFKLQILNYNHPEVIIEFNNQNHTLMYHDFLNGLFGPAPLEEFRNFFLFPCISGLDSI